MSRLIGSPVQMAIRVAVAVMIMATPGAAQADETDNFTCRGRLLHDSQQALDGWINARIAAAVERANRAGPKACDEGCLVRRLRHEVGGSTRDALTWVPHARLARWITRQPGLERCRLAFGESIYGARPYNQPWLLPFTGRIIFLADSILLSGRVVGIDKINHFIREGRAHRESIDERGVDVATVMARELGSPGRPLSMTEHGLKGLALTGVLSYADLAASYSGYRFWHDLLTLGQPGSFVAHDAAQARFVVQRAFTFGDYVNDAWDETINPSSFHPRVAKDVRQALRRRGIRDPAAECRELGRLAGAQLYVNPDCLRRQDSAAAGDRRDPAMGG